MKESLTGRIVLMDNDDEDEVWTRTAKLICKILIDKFHKASDGKGPSLGSDAWYCVNEYGRVGGVEELRWVTSEAGD